MFFVKNISNPQHTLEIHCSDTLPPKENWKHDEVNACKCKLCAHTPPYPFAASTLREDNLVFGYFLEIIQDDLEIIIQNMKLDERMSITSWMEINAMQLSATRSALFWILNVCLNRYVIFNPAHESFSSTPFQAYYVMCTFESYNLTCNSKEVWHTRFAGHGVLMCKTINYALKRTAYAVH